MRTIGIDARRYAWSRGNALWIMGPPIAQWMEDLDGAVSSGQRGLALYVARQVGESCAVMLALAERHEKPLPAPSLRAAWALDRIEGHELRDECWSLIRGAGDEESVEQVMSRCSSLVAQVRELVGEVPDPLTPAGYFPALALARDWLTLLQAVGEPSFLPHEWTKGTDDA